jgi:hypothetical protein
MIILNANFYAHSKCKNQQRGVYKTLSIENMWRNPMQSDILGVSLPSISIVIHRQGVPSANKLFVPRQAAFAESHNMCPKCLLGVVGVEFSEWLDK